MGKASTNNIYETFGEECLYSFFLSLWDTTEPKKIYLDHWFSNSGTHQELSGSWIYTFIIQTSVAQILGHSDSAGLTPCSQHLPTSQIRDKSITYCVYCLCQSPSICFVRQNCVWYRVVFKGKERRQTAWFAMWSSQNPLSLVLEPDGNPEMEMST